MHNHTSTSAKKIWPCGFRSTYVTPPASHPTAPSFSSPSRVYILKGFPVTDVDAAQFLEENDTYYSTSAKKRKSIALQPPKPGESDERPAFLSALDAVVQLTTR